MFKFSFSAFSWSMVSSNSLISSLANGTISVYINKNVSTNRDFVLFKSGEKIVAAYPFSLE